MSSTSSQPAMTTSMTTGTSDPGTADDLKVTSSTNGTGQANGGSGPHAAPSATTTRAPAKYRHVAAVHWGPRTSCLSHDSEVTPSFLGFRNLMVLVLSGFSLNPRAQVSKPGVGESRS